MVVLLSLYIIVSWNGDDTSLRCDMARLTTRYESRNHTKRKYELKKRAEQMAETRLRITEAAIELHGTVGPSRTTLSAVAERAGVERRTLYRHFPNEADLFAACSAHYFAANPWPDLDGWRAIRDSAGAAGAGPRRALRLLRAHRADVQQRAPRRRGRRLRPRRRRPAATRSSRRPPTSSPSAAGSRGRRRELVRGALRHAARVLDLALVVEQRDRASRRGEAAAPVWWRLPSHDHRPGSHRYKALSFDCYGTLIDWEAGIAAVLVPWAREQGLDAERRGVAARLRRQRGSGPAGDARGALPGRPGHRLPPHRRGLGRAGERRVGRSGWASSVGDWPAFPDSADALARLAEHYKLIILSNVHRDGFAGSNQRLHGDFAAIITAEDVGAYKPAENHFRALDAALRRARGGPRRAAARRPEPVPRPRPGQAGGPAIGMDQPPPRPRRLGGDDRPSPPTIGPAVPEFPSMAAFADASTRPTMSGHDSRTLPPS